MMRTNSTFDFGNNDINYTNMYNEKFNLLGMNTEDVKNGTIYKFYLHHKNEGYFEVSGHMVVHKENKSSYAFSVMKSIEENDLPKYDFIPKEETIVKLNYRFAFITSVRKMYDLFPNNLKYNECRINNRSKTLLFMIDKSSPNHEEFKVNRKLFKVNKDCDKKIVYLIKCDDNIDKMVTFLKYSNLRVLDLRGCETRIPEDFSCDVILHTNDISLKTINKNILDSFKVQYVEINSKIVNVAKD